LKVKHVSRDELKKLLMTIDKERVVTPYENAEEASGWVFVVVFSIGTYYFIGVDHFTDYGNGLIRVEWYPAGVYLPAMLKDVLAYYPYGWVE